MSSNDSNVSTLTLCIKYALARVSKEDVEWIFNGLFGEDLVMEVNELVKKDRYSGKDFKIFFIKCNVTNQKLGNLDRLDCKIKAKGMAKVTIDEYGHYWQVSLAIEKPKPAEFKPSIVEEGDTTVAELEKAMEALQTKDEMDCLHGTKRGAAEEGEVVEPKRERTSGIFEVKLALDDPIVQAAIEDTARHFKTKGHGKA